MQGQKVFCDVRVFNPLTKCHCTKTLAKVHKQSEKEKKVKYAARIIEVEDGSFTPLVFSCFGGMSRECSFFYKRLAEKLAEKRNLSASVTLIGAANIAETDMKLANEPVKL